MNINIPIEEQKINAIRWLNALLSGDYKQDQGRLGNSENGFCCWGVGCIVTNISFEPDTTWDKTLYEYIGFNTMLGTVHPKISNYGSLDSFNDDLKLSFKEIAAYLIKYSNSNFSPEISVHIDEYYENNEEVQELIKNLITKYAIDEVFEEEELCG